MMKWNLLETRRSPLYGLGKELGAILSKEQILLNVRSKPTKMFYSDLLPTGSTDINYAHKEILFLLEEACRYYDLSRKHLTFYVSHEQITSVRTDVWYDTGGVKIPCFYGVYVLSSEDGAHMLVDNVICKIYPGALYLWESGKRITYSHEDIAMLGFNVVPKAMIKNQDMDLWTEL